MLPPKPRFEGATVDACLDGRRTIPLQGVSTASISCTRSPNTPPTRGAGEDARRLRWLYNFIKQGTQLRQDLLPASRSGPTRRGLGAPHGELTQDPAKRLGAAEVRGSEYSCGDAGDRDGFGVRTVAHHSAAPR